MARTIPCDIGDCDQAAGVLVTFVETGDAQSLCVPHYIESVSNMLAAMLEDSDGAEGTDSDAVGTDGTRDEHGATSAETPQDHDGVQGGANSDGKGDGSAEEAPAFGLTD